MSLGCASRVFVPGSRAHARHIRDRIEPVGPGWPRQLADVFDGEANGFRSSLSVLVPGCES
jgi:hypothetical protein